GNGAAAVLCQRILEEFAHFATTFTDKRKYDGIEALRASEHREQRRFADAGTGEDADALACAERREEIHHTHARFQRGANPLARHRGRWLGIEGIGSLALAQRTLAVYGSSEGVQDAALPRNVGTQALIAVAPSDLAGTDLETGVEWLDGCAFSVDAHHLAQL